MLLRIFSLKSHKISGAVSSLGSPSCTTINSGITTLSSITSPEGVGNGFTESSEIFGGKVFGE